MRSSLAPAEEATIRAFIVKERRDRFLQLLANPKRRDRITDWLNHPDVAWFESKCVKPIPPDQRTSEGIAGLLHAMGAGKTCWVISADPELDGQEAELDIVLSEIVGYGAGAIVCCVPGELAFVETELTLRFILAR